MSLTSTVFYAFLIAGLLVYYILPAKFRWVWLLIMSYVYYCIPLSATMILIVGLLIRLLVCGLIMGFSMIF